MAVGPFLSYRLNVSFCAYTYVHMPPLQLHGQQLRLYLSVCVHDVGGKGRLNVRSDFVEKGRDGWLWLVKSLCRNGPPSYTFKFRVKLGDTFYKLWFIKDTSLQMTSLYEDLKTLKNTNMKTHNFENQWKYGISKVSLTNSNRQSDFES